RHVDHRRLAGELAAEERGGDAARDRHAARRVAEGGALHDRLGGAGRRERVGDPAAAPERGRVVAAPLALGAARALPVATHVDDLRVDAADVVHLDREPPPGRGEEVGQEDVGCLDQAVEEVAPGGAAEVEADAPLAAVRLLDHEVDAARWRDEAGGDEPAKPASLLAPPRDAASFARRMW